MGTQRSEDNFKFKARLIYTMSSKPDKVMELAVSNVGGGIGKVA